MKSFEKLFPVFLLLLAITACEPIDPDGGYEPSNAARMTRFTFPSSLNPGMRTTASATRANEYYFITVPEGTDLTKLVPEITVSEGATVSLDGAPFVPGTSHDFSGNVQMVKVVSQDGSRTSSYRICVKTGDNYIDQKVYAFMNDFNIPGVSISIMKGTEVVYSSGYGFAVQETETRCTPDHLFRMASISKQFCTMCIMTLKEEGRLKLDDTVFGENGILKGLYQNVTPYHESITIRHLLSHSSGICKGLSDPAFTWSYSMYDNGSPVPTDTLIQRTLNDRQYPDFDEGIEWYAGAAYNYSNVGYCILHRIVEVVSGKDYESYLKEDVLSKMDITDTHIGGYYDERRSNECVYYMQDGREGYSNPLRELAGAAGIITSTNQMMRILTFMDGDDTVPDIFSYETLQEMYSPYPYAAEDYKRYGLGWRLNHSTLFPGGHYHGGNLAGTATLWAGGTNQHMNGAFICNSRAYSTIDGSTFDTWMYVLLDEFMRHFE